MSELESTLAWHIYALLALELDRALGIVIEKIDRLADVAVGFTPYLAAFVHDPGA